MRNFLLFFLLIVAVPGLLLLLTGWLVEHPKMPLGLKLAAAAIMPAYIIGLLFSMPRRQEKESTSVAQPAPHAGPRPPWIHPTAWAQRTDIMRYPMGRAEPGFGMDMELVPMPGAGPRLEVDESVPDVDPEALLAETPNIVGLWNPGAWPVCCRRLATLMWLEPTPEETSQMGFVEGVWADMRAAGNDDQDELVAARALHDSRESYSIAVFACSVCGRAAASVTHT